MFTLLYETLITYEASVESVNPTFIQRKSVSASLDCSSVSIGHLYRPSWFKVAFAEIRMREVRARRRDMLKRLLPYSLSIVNVEACN